MVFKQSDASLLWGNDLNKQIIFFFFHFVFVSRFFFSLRFVSLWRKSSVPFLELPDFVGFHWLRSVLRFETSVFVVTFAMSRRHQKVSFLIGEYKLLPIVECPIWTASCQPEPTAISFSIDKMRSIKHAFGHVHVHWLHFVEPVDFLNL